MPDMTEYSKNYRRFIDVDEFERLLQAPFDPAIFRDALDCSSSLQPLDLRQTAALITATDPDLIEQMGSVARELKHRVYGNRIVLFAPLYIGNRCVNDCQYCGFRRSNRDAVRISLTLDQVKEQTRALIATGQKRLILVFGEHAEYSPEFIAECARTVYSVKEGPGEIRRVNINAAPLDIAGYRTVKDAGIGTYQVFQETYHPETYARWHPKGTLKADYDWRLDALSRGMEAGLDDVGIGALFGLGDWRFEVLGLVAHAHYLQQTQGVGPHTISFPRLRPASGLDPAAWSPVDDKSFLQAVTALRLAVPYTGMIMTCRESPAVRRAGLEIGVTQIDAGTRLELGGYTDSPKDGQDTHREQFELADTRSLDEVSLELIRNGHIPSFCTACYRLGRTGEVFMEFAIPGFIQRCCSPNALATLQEYLCDYASEETRREGARLIAEQLQALPEAERTAAQQMVDRVLGGERDVLV